MTPKKNPNESSTFTDDQISEAARKASEATPIEPEVIPAGTRAGPSEPAPEAPAIDPAVVHAAMVKVVKGAILRIDTRLGWKNHPDSDWCESTTLALELVLGRMAASPWSVLAFNLAMHVLANVSIGEEAPAAPAAAAAQAAA